MFCLRVKYGGSGREGQVSMQNQILKLGSILDWITPLVAFVQDIQQGPSVGFAVPVAAGWPAGEITANLRACGVRSWGMMMVDEMITFRVRKAQARYAQYLMDRAGIPYHGGLATRSGRQPVRTPGAPHASAAPPKPASTLQRSLDGLAGFVDRI